VNRRFAVLVVVLASTPFARSLSAQRPDSGAVATGRFIGRIVNAIDSTPVRQADLRLFFVDSARTVHARRGDSLEIFIDTAKSRVTSSDSIGAFAVRRLTAGHYLLQIRRIGFRPLEAAMYVDTGAVGATFVAQPTSALLAKVEIKEMSVDRAKDRLDRVGYFSRRNSGESGTFIDRGEILKRQPQTVEDLLRYYGVYDGDIVMDRMPLDFESLRNYPADLVLGVEIYRHGRPTEFNGTRAIPTMFKPGGLQASMAPLIVIWTFIP
jgi:hypothetical protein